MSDLLTEHDLKTERATEPPKRWRNWYRANVSAWHQCATCGHIAHADAGDAVGTHCRFWPSKDVAEAKAAESVILRGEMTYLGAFPDGEAP